MSLPQFRSAVSVIGENLDYEFPEIILHAEDDQHPAAYHACGDWVTENAGKFIIDFEEGSTLTYDTATLAAKSWAKAHFAKIIDDMFVNRHERR